MNFLKKIINRLLIFFKFLFIAISKRKKDFTYIIFLNIVNILLYMTDDSLFTKIYFYVTLVIYVVYFYIISEYEYQTHKYEDAILIQRAVRNLLEFIYDEINNGTRITGMVIYVNEKVYNYINESDLINFVDVRIDPDRDLNSFGHMKKSELKSDIKEFFEYD